MFSTLPRRLPRWSRWRRITGSCWVNRRGFGASPAVDGEDFDVDAGDLAEVLAEEPTHLVGHSYGGVVSLIAAAQVPDSVQSLTVFEPPAFGLVADDPEVRRFIDAIQAMLTADPPPEEFLRRFAALVGGDPSRLRRCGVLLPRRARGRARSRARRRRPRAQCLPGPCVRPVGLSAQFHSRCRGCGRGAGRQRPAAVPRCAAVVRRRSRWGRACVHFRRVAPLSFHVGRGRLDAVDNRYSSWIAPRHSAFWGRVGSTETGGLLSAFGKVCGDAS